MTSLVGYDEFYLVLFSHYQFSFMLIVVTSNIHSKTKHPQGQKQPASSQSHLLLLIPPPPLPMEELILKATELF